METCLTHWNRGEDFPSLGIGHFIWYRDGQDGGFEETFPQMLYYLQQQGVTLPGWLADPLAENNPWPDRDSFYADFDKAVLTELRQFLYDTRELQAAFIVQRFQNDAQKIVDSTAPAQRQHLQRALQQVAIARPPLGLYALIDYLHFKGSGLNASERYNSQGWGLQQVLLRMRENEQSLEAFVAAARQLLAERVANAPAERNEQRWLQGWHNRVDSYLLPPVDTELAR